MPKDLNELVKPAGSLNSQTRELPDWLTPEEQKEFAIDLSRQIGRYAFGTLPKREVDLLIFHRLSKAQALSAFTTYQWANLLRISETRVRSLRADAALRFTLPDTRSALTQIARQFNQAEKTCLEYAKEHGRVKMLLDDPALQREFEFSVRSLGHIPDYSFNRSVLDVPVTTFVTVFLVNFPEHKLKFEAAFRKLAGKDDHLVAFVDQTKSLGERFEAAWEAHSGKREALSGLIGAITAILVA